MFGGVKDVLLLKQARCNDCNGGKLIYLWQLQNIDPVVQNPVIDRVALHAWKLEFNHPTTEKMVEFEAPLPQDFQNLLDMLRKYRKP